MSSNNTSESASLEGKKILWVEDDEFLATIVAQKASLQGIHVIHAGEGKEALKLLEQERCDIIVLDLMLPNMDGFEILQNVKASEKTKNIPVIILSNLGQAHDIQKAHELGANLFLVKAEHSVDEVIKSVIETLQKGS